MAHRKIRVGIVFGGRSGEHEVSLASARGIMHAIDTEKYDVVPIGITKAGRWIAGGDPLRQLRAESNLPRELAVDAASHEAATAETLLAPLEPGESSLTTRQAALDLDVVFPVLHGPFGEDGTVQGLFELAGIPYVGAGVTASAVGMDKAIMKDIFRAHSLPVVEHVVIKRRDWEAEPDAALDAVEASLVYPVFTKPANMGSSVGVKKCNDRNELRAGLGEAARYDRKILAEQGIPAREIEVSVLGNEDPIASVAGEIIPSRDFYSYAAKYLDDTSDLLIPAPLSDGQMTHVRRLAVDAYRALDCAGMARVDFLLHRETGDIYLNELNTIPGFTPISMYPKLWEASGLSYAELIDRLIELALERHADARRSETAFDVSQAE
jgi:D-alanine-D-alanine ligase